MPTGPENTHRDVVVAALGTASVNVVLDAKSHLQKRYRVEDKFCHFHYLLVDTDDIPPSDVDPRYESVESVRLADYLGRVNGREYVSRVVMPHLERLQAEGLIPSYVDQELLRSPLIQRMETGEANKNPLKGYLYFLANMRRVDTAIRRIGSSLLGGERTIYLVFSPVSGTAAGGWYLLLSLLFDRLPDARIQLLNLMPSLLRTKESVRNRSYGIYGWSARLLEQVTHRGIEARLVVPQLDGAPVELSVSGKQPLIVQVSSAFRRKGSSDLGDTESFFSAVSEQLAVLMIGKHETKGDPSSDSRILDLETDLRVDETPAGPCKRYCARGYCVVRHNEDLAIEVTARGLELVLLSSILDEPPLTNEIREEVRAALRAHFLREVSVFYVTWHEELYEEAWTNSLVGPSGSVPKGPQLATSVMERVDAFRERLYKTVDNVQDERSARLRARLWEVVQRLVRKHGCAVMEALPSLLAQVTVTSEDVSQASRFAGTGGDSRDLGDLIAFHRQSGLTAHRTLANQGESNRELMRSLCGRAVEGLATATLLETLDTRLVPMLDEARQYYQVESQALLGRLSRVREVARTTYNQRFNPGHTLEEERNQPAPAAKLASKFRYSLTHRLAQRKINLFASEFGAAGTIFFTELPPDLSSGAGGPDEEEIRRRLRDMIGRADNVYTFESSPLDVIELLGRDADLLRLLLGMARAHVRLGGSGYAVYWALWHSGEPSEEMTDALSRVEEAARRILSSEDFNWEVNRGRLPLRKPGDIEVVLSEIVADFALIDTASDETVTRYLELDEAMNRTGSVAPIHRVHTDQVRFGSMGEGGAVAELSRSLE